MSSGRPIAGAIVGALIGVVVVIIVQQAGVWPADQLAVFGAIGLFGILGALLASLGRSVSRAVLIVLIILLLIPLAWGLVGLGESLGGTGAISGGCTVAADSYGPTGGIVDTFDDPSQTSARDPFDVDPAGSIDWEATSPNPIQDYSFEIGVYVGGFMIPLSSETNTNADLNTENMGSESVAEYTSIVSDLTGIEPRGIYNVSGSISGEGGACMGNGYVRLLSDGPFDGTIAVTAWILLVILIIILMIIIVTGRGGAPVANGEIVDPSAGEPNSSDPGDPGGDPRDPIGP